MRTRLLPALIASLGIGIATGPGVYVFAQDGPRFVDDEGHVAVFEHDGSSYDTRTPKGDRNSAPRQAIARKFIETHGDFYDFIVVFTNFDFDRLGAKGVYHGVRNDVTGTGGPTFDDGASYGSARRLQGFIDMGPLSQYRSSGFSLDPSSPGFRATLGILGHEIGHRWLARVRYLDGAEVRSDLLGKDGSHWSYLLSSDASFLYGSHWEPVGAGLYRATEVQARYSALDLYLMGLLPPDEVPPLVLLRNPDVDTTKIPELGASISATEEVVALDQIVAAEGQRSPSFASSPKEFRLGFVLLTETDLVASPLDIEAVDRVRAAFVTTFFSLTRGRGLTDTDLLNVIPPLPTASPDTTLALDWLLGRQGEDGRFEDDPRTSLRDTSRVLETLALLGVEGEPVAGAEAWLAARTPTSVDALSRSVASGGPQAIEPLLLAQNADGGWGLASGYRSDPLDTSLAFLALTRRDVDVEQTARERAASYLAQHSSAEGGWSSIPESAPDLLATCAAGSALSEASAETGALQAALAWLVTVQQSDGGFGDGPSTPYATACAAELLLDGSAPASAIDRALDYLRKTQRTDGSWEGSVYQTAEVLHALVPASVANLEVRASDIVLEPAVPEVGETAEIEVTVRNRSRVPAGSFRLELFDGDPELGGVEIGSTGVASLAAGASSTTRFSWSTLSLEGPHVLVAVADIAGAVPELNKADNRASRDVEVLPQLPNLTVQAVTSVPPSPVEGAAAEIRVRVGNGGTLAAPGSSVRLYEGHPSLGVVVGESSVPPLASGTAFEVAFSWDTSSKVGRRRLTAVADPERSLRERFENDNEASIDVDVRPPPPPEPDLVVTRKDLVLAPARLSTLPSDVSLTALVRNTGASPVPGTLVSLYQGDPDAGGMLLGSRSVDVPGDGGVEAVFGLSVTTGGSRTYWIVVDEPNAVVERDESNNRASIDLVDPMDTVDLALVASSLTLSSASLTSGETLVVGVDVGNRGTRKLSAAPVTLFVQGTAKATASLDLAPGETVRVELSWKANRLGSIPVELRADPDDRFSELDEDNNRVAANVEVAGSGLPNLTVASADIETSPAVPIEGEPATVSARIRNVGDADAGAFRVSFFAGDPASGGLRIGTVSVPSLASASDIGISADWSEVNVRGTTLLYVVVDESSMVSEFDEADNRAFLVVDVVGLPDLSVSSASLELDPPFARSGELLSIEAVFRNSGQQDAADVVGEIRVDDPASGPLLASETFSQIAPGEVVSFDASWDTSGVEGEHTIFLVVDVLGSVREQREDNNVARAPVALQDSDLYVSPPYFSPDGNGVQDEATFFYRVVANAVSVDVIDSDQEVVRHLASGTAGEGSATWDGRTDGGLLAPDGDYYFVLSSDGAELTRGRVVLDTNRSSVAEALGSAYVGIANLTCPLPEAFYVSGPAFLPDDSAAYFLSRREGLPDTPEGLYRASVDGSLLEPIATGGAFSSLRFFEQTHAEAERMVSPDGAQALATSDADGLALLDLATGAVTPLGRFADDARWSPDGSRVLVSDRDGIYLYSSAGAFVSQISTREAELVEWSPDGSRIVYRPWEETVLHVMNADGGGDRALPATDARTLLVVNEPITPETISMDRLFFLRGGESVVFGWFHFSSEESSAPFELDLAAESLTPLERFDEISSDRRWVASFYPPGVQRFGGREIRSLGVASVSEGPHWSYRDTYLSYEAPPEPACEGYSKYLLRSLLNGEARFRLTALPSGFGVRISGTVADRNLDRYRLEYAPLETPTALVPIQPPSSTPVVNDTLATWLPPAQGEYIVRLTLRDRAGNEVVRLDRVSWTKTLPIAGLRRAPPAISPNGDGVQDEVVVDYNVLEPVNLVFHVRDSEGTVVRTLVRDEATLGPASFAWDGTDDGGGRVEDGRYVLEVSGAEFPVLVDATPPEVEAQHSDLYTHGLALAVDLEGRVEDDNLASWSLVEANGEVLVDSVRPVGSSETPALLVEAGFPIQGLELRASDVAGNVTAIPLTGPKREVRVVSRSFRSQDVPVGPFEPGPAGPVLQTNLLPKDLFGFSASASFLSHDLRFFYQEEGESDPTEIPASKARRLSARDFPVGTRFVGHFESEGLSSQEVSFIVGNDAIFLDADSQVPLLHLANTIEEELIEGTVYMTIGTEKRALETYRPVPLGDTLPRPPVPCGTEASFYMEATGASGRTYLSTTTIAYPVPTPASVPASDCLSVVDAAIDSQSSSQAELPSSAVATLLQSFREPPDSVALLLSDGSTTSEVARLVPTVPLQVPFDVSALAEGPYTLRARAELPGGISRDGDFALAFTLDQSPPLTAIVSPVEGGSACVVEEGGSEWVELEIQGQDRRLSGFRVELSTSFGWSPVRTQPRGTPPSFPSATYEGRVLAEIPRGLEGSQRFRVTFASDRIVDEGTGRPSPVSPPLWPNLRNNGSILGSTIRNVVILRRQTLSGVGASPSLFSPNGDGILDETHLAGELGEAATLTLRVVRVAGSVLVRTIVSDVSVGTGTFSFSWDGRDDLGNVVADGDYRMELVAVNGCGATSKQDVLVEVDATPPVVEIAAPGALEPVAIGIEVRGTATDDHFLSYQLEFGEGESPLAFEPVVPLVESARRDTVLGNWSVGDLPPGLYTLRLSASDRAGNSASTSVVVDIRSPDLIESFDSDEPLFSPNGDGIKDAVAFAFRLKRDASVTLTVRRPDESVVATLLSGESLLAGDNTSSWDGGAPAPDGEYVVDLYAEDALFPGVNEETRLTIAVDTLAPSVSLTAPSPDSYVALPSNLLGAIEDENLERFTIDLGPENGALAPLSEDSLPRSGSLASLVGLVDGGYRLQIHAADRAGNTAQASLHFFVDSTPPAVSLLSPAAGAIVPTSEPIAVEGRLVETNLESYALELGAGPSPSVYVPLSSGTSLASPELALDWDVAALPDGVYTLRLRATDQSGTSSETSRTVVLDGTPPTVALEEPLEGAFVERDALVVGTATDENFAGAILGVAGSSAPAQDLVRFESPVLDGVLHQGLPLQDGSYRLSLVARDLAGNETSVERAFTIDTVPPSTPEGLGTVVEERANVRLTWTPNEETDLAGYLVYRDGVLLTEEPIAASEFLDPGRPEGRFRYTVVAVDRAGHASDPSLPVEARIDLTPPTVLLRSPDEGARVRGLVDIVGTAFAETDFREYRLSVAAESTPSMPTLLRSSPVPVTFATLFQWEAVALDGGYILTLEGEDTAGNVARASIHVIVDNEAPAPPVLTSVTATSVPEDVEIQWEPSPSTDVDGYLVYRNGSIANAPVVVSGDLRPFLVPGPSTLDPQLPDGRFCYHVVAMDLAGNLGSESNELCIVLDNHTPAAVLVEPEDGARFDSPQTVRASTSDQDVASVLFQVQPVGAATWTDIGSDVEQPFELVWDVTALAFGDYLLRAVATDAGGRSDPDPAAIAVVLGDTTAPAPPSNLRAAVDGDTVTVSWDAVSDGDVAGYRVYRDGVVAFTVGLETTASDTGRPDGLYRYEVAAFDGDDNESTGNETAEARIYAPSLLPAFPIFEGEVIDLPGEGASANAEVELFFQGTSTLVGSTTAGSDGSFVFSDLALPAGETLLEARATDFEGNRSRLSDPAFLVRNQPPAAPSDLIGTVNGDAAELSWSANVEPDLSGYVAKRDGESVSPDGRILPAGDVPTTVTATASSGFAPYAFDGNLSTTWSASFQDGAWLQVRLSAPRHLREVLVRWGFVPARDFRVLGRISGRLVPLATVRDNTETETRLEFPFAPSTAELRIEVSAVAPSARRVDISEVELYGSAPFTDVAVTDTPARSGSYRYEVAAIDLYGGTSAPSSVDLTVGDVEPPEPPSGLVASVDLADVTLTWTPSSSADVSAYRIDRDGVPVSVVAATTTSTIDPNLPNGSYHYRVAAVDEAENESGLSNEAVADVSVDSPSPPALTVNPVPEGGALALDWTPSTGPLGVAEYAVLRAAVSGGPYVELARVASLGFRDEGLANGVPYFYVVRAFDPRGEASSDSNEARGTPADEAPPSAPLLLRPTTADVPITLAVSRTDVSGRAEPGSRVALYRGSDLVREVDAASSLVDTRVLQLTVAGAERVMSADRMHFAEVGLDRIRLIDLATGGVRVVDFDSVGEAPEGASFSPRGDRVAVATHSGDSGALRIVDLGSGSTQVLPAGAGVGYPQWLDEDHLAIAEDNRVEIVTLSTEQIEVVYQALPFFVRAQYLLASPDRSRVAFLESSRLNVLDVATRTVTTVSFSFFGQFEWLSDYEMALVDYQGVHIADVDSGATELVPGTMGAIVPSRIAPGTILVFLNTGEVLLVSSDGSTENLGVTPIPGSQLFGATGDFRGLFFEAGGRGHLVAIPGWFEARDVALEPGINRMRAVATDVQGNESAPSLSIEVTFDDSLLPDLVLEGPMLVVPAVPASGDIVSVSFNATNAGASESPETVVQLSLSGSFGDLTAIGSASLAPIPAGGSVLVTQSWTPGDSSGSFDLLATIDPLARVDEKDESNNTLSQRVTVVSHRGIALSVATGLSEYSAGQDVEIRVEAVNGSASSDVVLETAIEDGFGNRVATVDRRSASLRYGEAAAYIVFWNAGSTPAGSYVARVVADDSASTASPPFEIRRFFDVRATVGTERGSYVQGAPVTLLATVANGASNTPVRDASLELSVVDGSSPVLFQTEIPLSYLAVGGTTSASALWPKADAPPGTYAVTLRVVQASEVLATAAGSFEIEAATEVELGGTLVLENENVPVGAEVVAQVTVTNVGVLALTDGDVRVALLDPASGLVTLADSLLLDLAPGETFADEIRLPTDGQALGRRFVLLEANGRSLASAPLYLFDIPAPPSANFPAEGASAPQPLRLSVNNATNPNGEHLTYEFEIYLDDSLRFLIGSGSGITEGLNTTTWESPLALEENRRYVWRARARDRFAVSDWMPPASFFSDSANDPPGAPSLSSPADDSEVDTRAPVLRVVNAVDPEGAALTYTFEVYADAALSERVLSLSPIAEGDGETSAAISTLLDEDRTYYWRARATDGELDSDWMLPASFRVNTGNQPPTRPEPVAPVGGDSRVLTPELSAKAGLDPEGDAVTHRFEIDMSPSFDTPALQSGDGLFAAGELVRFTPPLALSENAVYFWRVRASDGLATSAWSEVASFRVDIQNEAPSVPRPESPIGGAIVATTTPALVIVNAADPEGDPLRYDVEVYDETMTTLVASLDGLREGEGHTVWVVSPRLDEDHSYQWRARATDGTLASGWSPPEAFLVNAMNAKPAAPSLGSPDEGDLVSVLPVSLGVVNGVDPDGDALTYRFEVYRDENLTELVEASPEIAETADQTFWEMSAALDENHIYYWRARSFDGSLESSWMPTARFRLSLVNEAPGIPVLVSPENGAELGESRPLLEVDNAQDPDGDTLRYVFEIYADAALTTLVVASPPVDPGDPRTSWRVSQDLAENETYFWRALATDGALESASADVFRFLVNAVEEPPTAPTLLEPPNGKTVETLTPTLVIENAGSPDGHPLVYEFELYEETTLVASQDDVPEGSAGTTQWGIPLELDSGPTYSWRARAVDDRGLVSEWTEPWSFTVEPPATACPPEWSEDFNRFTQGDVPPGWRLRLESGEPEFEVRSKRLVNRSPSRAAFVFEGSGEAYGWRNYELQGVLLLPEENGRHNRRSGSACGLSAGIVFYSTANGEYRLEVEGPRCRHPKARLVARSSSGERVLAERELEVEDDDDDPIAFRIEVANDSGATRILAELHSKERRTSLSAEDATEPLRAGTIGAWSDFVPAAWDDFHVREITGYESGISGDENRDGVCDVESQACDDPVEVCLDGGVVPVSCSGDCGHSGPTACGAKHSYFVKNKTGILFVETPSLDAGTYRFRLLLHPEERAGEPVVRVELDTGASFDVSGGSEGWEHHERSDKNSHGHEEADDEGHAFAWSRGFDVELPAGVTTFRIRSLVKSTVFVEAFRLEPSCK